MKSLVHIIPILLSVLVLSGRIDARIINVPNDFETIQAGIDEAEEGDTVLVQPGEYVETIVFPGTDIIVGSHFIIEEDEDFITETIIDGDQNGSVVTFSDLGDAVPQLIGFTVRNGGIHGNGGGIYCRHANPILTNLVITENQALNGGGLYFDYSQATLNNTRIVGNSAALGGGLLLFHHPDISMQNVIIEGNEAENTGGGLLIWESNPVLTDVIIRDNIAGTFGGGMRFDHANPILTRVAILNNVGSYGGGIETNWDSNPVLINLTIVGNEADRDWGGGIDCGDSDVTMVNCIVWNNEPLNIRNAGNIEATYSDFENGFEGEGNISDDPLFVDPDEGDYNLTEDSPCIDAGDPESDPDPDGTRADMGAFSFYHGGVAEIWVFDAENDRPLEGLVFTNYGFTAATDENGFCRMINLFTDIEFSLTARVAGYNDSTAIGLSMGMDDTLEVVFSLLHPEFNVDPEEIRATLMQGESTEIDIMITNRGNGLLEWTVQPRGPGGFEPWELRQSIGVSEIVNDSRIEGVVFADSLFYVVGANYVAGIDEPNTIYVLNKDGELLDAFPQPDTLNSPYGMKDLAWDGNLIWGSGCRRIAGMNLEGEVEVAFDGPYPTNRALAWDPDHEVLWVSDITRGITSVRREDGEVVTTLDRKGFRIYGLAYWEDDPDGYPLYIFHNPSECRQHVHKMNPDNGDTMFAVNLGSLVEGSAGGVFITDSYDMNNFVFIDIANDAAEDRIDIWQLGGVTSWMQIEPEEGLVEADMDQIIEFTIDATDLDVRVYEGILEFRHNAAGGMVSVPVTLTVTPLAVTDRGGEVPFEFGIVDVYPNPFNSTARLTFTLPKREHVILRLYDILGREVEELLDEDMCSGRHNVTISAEKLATGVYIARLEGLSNAAFMKLVVIK